MGRGALIWVGAGMPAGLDATQVASAREVPPGAGVVVIGAPATSMEDVTTLLATAVAVVVCVPCVEAWTVRRWSEEGAYCLCLEHHPTVASLTEWLARVRREHQPTTATRLRRLARRIDSARFSVSSLEDAEALAEVLAHLLPDSMRRVAGIVELLVNAVEHGNLGITSAEKHGLLRTGRWRQEILRRSRTSPWQERKVRVWFDRTDDDWTLVIEDEGEGFTPPAAELTATSLNGRGLSLARAAFDSLTWEGRGNRVVAKVRRHE